MHFSVLKKIESSHIYQSRSWNKTMAVVFWLEKQTVMVIYQAQFQDGSTQYLNQKNKIKQTLSSKTKVLEATELLKFMTDEHC